MISSGNQCRFFTPIEEEDSGFPDSSAQLRHDRRGTPKRTPPEHCLAYTSTFYCAEVATPGRWELPPCAVWAAMFGNSLNPSVIPACDAHKPAQVRTKLLITHVRSCDQTSNKEAERVEDGELILLLQHKPPSVNLRVAHNDQ